MDLKVEITSSESIKPSSQTAGDRLRAHKLTVLDQTAPASYIPICLFYPYDATKPSSQTSFADSLKASLSRALNIYYPLAGRYKDAFSVDCNDAGVDFLEARVACRMSDALQQPDEDRLLALLPCRPQGRRADSEGRLVLLAAQVSFFECGGVSIGVCMWHGLSDACTLSCFLRTWSRIAMASEDLNDDATSIVVKDCTDVFPPRDLSVVSECMERYRTTAAAPGTRIKRFVFEGDKVAALRAYIEKKSLRDRPSRVQAISAVIWAATIKIARGKMERRDAHIAAMTTNLRQRMNPPGMLGEEVMGNLVQIPVFAEWAIDKEEEEGDDYYAALAGKLRDSVKMVNDENVRKAMTGTMFLDVLRYFVEAYGGGDLLAISSWCRFPFYEVDFGLGDPVWMCFFTMCCNLAVLFDTKDGRGIEAWVTLDGDDMLKFENDAGVLRYATSSSVPVVAAADVAY